MTGGQAEAFTQTGGGYVCVDNEETTAALFPPQFSWDEISATGQIQNAGNNPNIGSFAAPGFNFNYFGVIFNNMGMNSNGYLVPGNAIPNVDLNTPVPNAGGVNNTIAGFWDDLVPNLNPNNVRSQVLGVAPDRRLVISWTAIPLASGLGTVTFQFAIFEGGGANAIRIQYQTMTGAQANGSSASVGIENNNGTLGVGYLADGIPATNNTYNGLAVGFYAQGTTPPWPVVPPPPPPAPPGGAAGGGIRIDKHDNEYDNAIDEFRTENCSAAQGSSGASLLLACALAIGLGALLRPRS